jgi:hemerythrin
MLIWDESMTTGQPNLDAQHQELFERYNRLSEALKQGSGSVRTATGEMLDFLQFYAAWHFEREEECMEEHRCPFAEANKNAHAQFIEMFGQFYEQWQESDTDMALVRQTYEELGNWIENHIMRIDTQLLTCAKK